MRERILLGLVGMDKGDINIINTGVEVLRGSGFWKCFLHDGVVSARLGHRVQNGQGGSNG